MSSSSKRKKGPPELSMRLGEDRISNLPTSLITKILSSIPTKDAVKTSVLSTNWKRSWAYVTNLDFEDVKNYHYDLERDLPRIRKFTSFVNRILLLRNKSCLQKFSLKGYHDYDGSFVNAWLVVILQCNVQELDISIRIKHPGILPSEVFLCNTLVVLKLCASESLVKMRTSARLLSLKTLHLRRVQFCDDVSITNILSGCPVLEELTLSMCQWENVGVKIIAPSLEKLTIEDENAFQERQIVIDTPSLLYFDLSTITGKVFVVNMGCLVEAKIDFGYYVEDLDDTDHQFGENHSDDIEHFVHKISQVEKLVLSIGSVLTISLCKPVLPKFSKLTYLELNESGDRDWKFLPKLLKNSPCLQTLNIQKGVSSREKDDVPLPFHDVPYCFRFHLKKVEIGLFEYFKGEMDIVKYILKNAKVLEKLTLHTDEDDATFYKELLSFPRASPTSQVEVCE